MSGSNFGKLFKITTYGESHGKALGVIVDGCPSGLDLNEDDIQRELDKRKPGTSKFTTKRNENDKVEILSGIFEGKTTGTPISLMVRNKDQKSRDYANIKDAYRPSHADFTYDMKYGFRDYRGGGRSSGRETIGRVAAGAIAKKILKELDIDLYAYTKSIGEISIDTFDRNKIDKNPLYIPDELAYKKAVPYIDDIKSNGDSIGGVVHCTVSGLKSGIGEPVFEKLDAMLSQAIFSIGAVKGVSFGNGFETSNLLGSQNNDIFRYTNDVLYKETNNSGGIIGGISDSFPIEIDIAIKPTPSISKPQDTINNKGENISLTISGRHDPIIVPRAIVVIESMVAITLVDYIFINTVSKLDNIKKSYCR